MNNPKDLPDRLYDFALIPNFEQVITNLKNLAETEDWDYQFAESETANPVLKNYLNYTYKRIAEEQKVSYSENDESACWNTGLITPNHEPIFMMFEKNNIASHNCYWHFKGFFRKGQHQLNDFTALPEMAHYFEEPAHLVYDARLELRPNVEHIVDDNKDRFPPELQHMAGYGLQNFIKGAIDSAVERVKRNYKTAIPQYFNGNIQLLLPLSLTDPSKADLALVVERFDGFYRASTCLTLDMAYNNARRLAKPDRDWLQP
ncbi:DUF3825 domain-containing protein [Vibrio parahaemolyticus]|nr:DUF3825 domain-containing protein [Vibrio parahaemolyticus]